MTIKLPVTVRDKATKLDALRKSGNVPAVVYGPKQEAMDITISAKEFDKVLKEAGESTIVELDGLKEAVEVLIKNVDFNPVKSQVVHVDFYAIELGKEMSTHVPLEFVGVAPVEEDRLGSVTKVLHEVMVTCMPKDLPSHIDVDVSSLVTIEDKIHISDLNVPKGVVIDMEADESVAVVSVAKEEVEEETEVDMDAIEVDKKGKEEEAEKPE